ncbi:hypothetical protein LJR219_000677 [Phenylobacterium sp. LjRoot219]|uniref:hypothetical protein n=1 Tax=Phenylobacterium sp. LjRoot219 TaxID=3342283 RepID=UPI003ECDAACB
MSVSIALPSLRESAAAGGCARTLLTRLGRLLLLTLGGLVLLVGLILAPLPGHVGLPLLVVGLMIVLRNSFAAKRRFLRLQRRYPKLVFPVRRLMRRKPEIVLVLWQQYLRLERLVLPRKARFAVKARRGVKRKLRRADPPEVAA